MKKVIILEHNGGRLGNQLWNYISIYAYCLEKKFLCWNYSFYKYDKYFNIKDKNIPYKFFLKIYRFSRLIKLNGYLDKIYNAYAKTISIHGNKKIFYSSKDSSVEGISYLPPTPSKRSYDILASDNSIKGTGEKIYLVYQAGWPFRNPAGIEKYRAEIKKYFLPKKNIRQPVENFIHSLRKKYKHTVGVHLRQGDYQRKFMDGELYFTENEIVEILGQYLNNFNKTLEETCFVLCSDGKINQAIFKNLNIAMAPGETMKDLYTLSLTDLIIGSDSTFGSFASYYGNIPHIIFDKKGIDWLYYKNKNKYFINKYSTVTKLN